MPAWLWKVVLTVCMACVCHRAMNIFIVTGFLKPLYNHKPGPCELVPGVVNGSEDIHTLSNGLSLISSGMNLFMAIDPDVKGQILTFDFHNPSAGARKVAMPGFNMERFNPLGLSAYEGRKTGDTTVFIINRWHELSGVGVEVFDLEMEDNLPVLVHKKTIKHENIYTPNNIVATSATTFYLTNDGCSDSSLIRISEILLGLRCGSVVYYDGKKAVQVVGSILAPNGIAVSHTRKHLYVASLLGESIEIYEIKEKGAVSFVKSIHMATMVDNLSVDSDTGEVYAAGMPSLRHAFSQDTRDKGTSQVLWMVLDGDFNAEIRQVFVDDGQLLRGSSVASTYKHKMLIGTVQGGMMFCHIQAF